MVSELQTVYQMPLQREQIGHLAQALEVAVCRHWQSEIGIYLRARCWIEKGGGCPQ